MQVGLIGAGNMARALARGWADPVLVSDSGSGRAAALAAELGGEALPSAQVAQRADLVVLCHKPAQLHDVAREVAGKARAVASILAATSSSVLHEAYPDAPVFRLTPNTPVEMRCVHRDPATPNGAAGSELEADVLALFARLGAVVKLPERLMDAAGPTPLSGTESMLRPPQSLWWGRWRAALRCSRRGATTRSPFAER